MVLQGAVMGGMILERADLSGVELRGRDLRGLHMGFARLCDTVLSEALLQGVRLEVCSL